MPSQYTGLSACDLSTIQFLKKQEFKSFPGGVFSLIYILLNLGILITVVLLFILEPNKMRSQTYKPTTNIVDSSTQDPSNSGSIIDVAISAKEKEDNSGIETMNMIDEFFILVRYYRKGIKVYAHLYQSTKKQLSDKKQSLTYAIPANELSFGVKVSGFPRIAFESCSFFNEDKEQKDYYLIVENPELLNKCHPKEDYDEFYNNDKIKGYFFNIAFTSDYHQLQTDFTIQSIKKTYDLFFQFERTKYDSYRTELNKISLQAKSSKPATEYNNWLLPDYEILAPLAVNNHYSFHMLFTSKYVELGVLFVIYKYGFLYYLQNLGAYTRVVDILTFIPSLWIPYYASLLVIQYYGKMEKKNQFETKEDDYDYSNLGYCQWLGIKLGCSSRKRKQNKRINDMRYLVAADFEKLYSPPNKDRNQAGL